MKKNIGTIDKIMRLILAALFLILFLTGTVTGTIGIILIIFAITFTATALFNFCPLYIPLKWSTKKD
ncbi:MAG: DUF2892 domain-containing protein [Candidatus Kapabacteria bacterium]|nr:DUF2892 domain-containing protein [Candidatus Kapabacteria bacterium]